jgi:phosphate/sulfate permease
VGISGFCNFLGVYLGGVAVAFSIVHLLPVDLLVNIGSHAGLAMIFALLLSAIIWNFGTWYKGLPASSTHTLVGSILGVGLTNAMLTGHALGGAINLGKTQEVFLALLVSPVLGFSLAAGMLLLSKHYIKDPELYEAPQGKTPPPWPIRSLLVLTCVGVSFAHGSNDGQKGVGLVMLILIGALPVLFAINPHFKTTDIQQSIASLAAVDALVRDKEQQLLKKVPNNNLQLANPATASLLGVTKGIHEEIQGILRFLDGVEDINNIPLTDRWEVRKYILLVDGYLKDLQNWDTMNLTVKERELLKTARHNLTGFTDYAPPWVMLAVALCIGLGTMVGWKRVVVTVGEKIGSHPMTYAQGGSAQFIAMTTIGLADSLGLPVSTTHVLSSGVAGTMVANKYGLEYKTLRDLTLAWILTLPAAMVMSGVLFLSFRLLVP